MPCKQLRSALPLPLIRPRWVQTIGNAEHHGQCHGAAAPIPSATWVEPIDHGEDGWGVVAGDDGFAGDVEPRALFRA